MRLARGFLAVWTVVALLQVLVPDAARAQVGPSTRLVRVGLGPALPLTTLLAQGFDVVRVRHGSWADVLVRPRDAARLGRLGARVEVLDDAVERHYAERAERELAAQPRPAPTRVRSAVRGDGVYRMESLPPLGSGSMGGHWTLAEVKTKLDLLVSSDTRDLVADKIDTLGWSVEGRPVWGLEVGKRVTGPDTRPVVFYSGLTHAREPMGMEAILYFVDDLLAGYGADPFATYLLDQRVIYVCPVVNPDGYEYNREINPGGGGVWRKNKRDNDGDGAFEWDEDGVDLNRNFGYAWGYDDVGSSPTPSWETYRGPGAFSEPETRAQRDAVISRRPKTGLAFHTHGDMFLHPWGHVPAATRDSAAFYEWDDEATLGTPYVAGQGTRVLYPVNGGFDDWAYGDTLSKPRGFTWTPEVGTVADGFWAPPSRIVPLAQENLRKCYAVAAIAGPYVRVESHALDEDAFYVGGVAHVAVRARNLGLGDAPASLTATLTALDAGTRVSPGAGTVSFPALPARASADAAGGATFEVSADDTLTPGRLVRFHVDFTAEGGYFSRDTLELLAGRPTVLLLEPCETLTGWSSTGGWGVVSAEPLHPSRYFADSPMGPYPNGADLTLTRSGTLDLSRGVHAWALLETRWLTESAHDGTLVEASLDGVTWTPLAGRGTSRGLLWPQSAGEPIYQASRYRWMTDRLDLSGFTGPAGDLVGLRFRTVSNTSQALDGFQFDSLRVWLFDPDAQPGSAAVDETAPALALAAPRPNPARDELRLGFTLPARGPTRLAIHDLQGRRVRTLVDAECRAGRHEPIWDLRDDAGHRVSPGVYHARLNTGAGALSRRLIVLP